MPKPKDAEPRYARPGEDGFWPQQTPPEEEYLEPQIDAVDIMGKIPTIVIGTPFEKSTGSISIGVDEVVELPPEARATFKVVELGKDGILHERPASANEVGGGLNTTPSECVKAEDIPIRTHKKSSRKVLDLP